MRRYVWVSVVVAVGLCLAALMLVWGERSAARVGSVRPHSGGDNDLAFVLCFDPAVQAFQVFTIPTRAASPWGIALAANATNLDVWFTETGVDRIGRLVYTSTADYVFSEYALAGDSSPLNLAVAGDGRVWFTAPGRNRIGRLDPATGQVDEFQIPTAHSYPADLALAADGSVWFTQMNADRVARLVVTSTTDYAVHEYQHALLDGGRPCGIVVAGGGVYFAQTANNRVTQFTPPHSWVHIYSQVLPNVPHEPYALVVDNAGEVWGTERAGNQVSRYEYGTFPIISRYALSPAGSLPVDIAVDGDNTFWIAQQGAAQLAHLTPSFPPRKEYVPLPRPDWALTSVAVDPQGRVWGVASVFSRIYLPLIQSAANQ